MNERVELPPVPTWLSALPFLFARGARDDRDFLAEATLRSAAAAMAADPERRDSRARICFLLAELASQYYRRTGDDFARIPVNRAQLARAAQINLTKVKRVLGFLLLSRVIEISSEGIRIVDWPRLCKLASYDRRWVGGQFPAAEDDDPPEPPRQVRSDPLQLTAAGDPASFV